MHYICSDIHGYYSRFLSLLEKIAFSESDEMYILGDVIDRGPRPITLLEHVLSSPNIHLLIGNHEHMMLSVKNRTDLAIWHQNGAETTLFEFRKRGQEKREEIIKAMRELPLVIPELKVNDRKYYLVHACPLPFQVASESFPYKNAIEDLVNTAVWDRRLTDDSRPAIEILGDVIKKYRDTTLIIGHTPIPFCSYSQDRTTSQGKPRITRAYHGRLINVDCGCGYGMELGCLRLEDHHEFYV